jgi:hypothetical protein
MNGNSGHERTGIYSVKPMNRAESHSNFTSAQPPRQKQVQLRVSEINPNRYNIDMIIALSKEEENEKKSINRSLIQPNSVGDSSLSFSKKSTVKPRADLDQRLANARYASLKSLPKHVPNQHYNFILDNKVKTRNQPLEPMIISSKSTATLINNVSMTLSKPMTRRNKLAPLKNIQVGVNTVSPVKNAPKVDGIGLSGIRGHSVPGHATPPVPHNKLVPIKGRSPAREIIDIINGSIEKPTRNVWKR